MTRLRSWEQKYVVSPINPYFISVKGTNLNFQGISLDKSRDNCVTRSFVFPGTKLNDLKLKVMAMTADSEQPIMNPTRLEVLNWLLYRCALRAASKSKSGSFKPTGFIMGIKDIKSEFEILQTMPLESVIEEEQRKGDDYYTSTSICTYPLYGIDFGWGKPIKASIAGTMANNNLVAVDTRNGGTEVALKYL
nr:acylsugar acyltransferase 3-like [Tanacetum cinerariifolium]